MVPTITTILQRFTGEWATLLQPEAIQTVCREIGYTAWRDRVLTPVTTMQLFLLQILHGHTACSHLPHLSGLRFSAAAYCLARARLPLRCFDLLLERFGSAVQRSALDEGRWQGHRTFLVDGSGCSMPDTPALQQAFGQPTEQRPGCGFPVARLLGLFHAGSGVLLKLVVAPLLTHTWHRSRRCIRPSNQGMCWWPIGASVRMPMWPSSSRPACLRCCASARDTLSISRPVGRWSGRVCGGHLLSKACPAPAGSKRSASTTNSWRG
jgi:hypothetical protein